MNLWRIMRPGVTSAAASRDAAVAHDDCSAASAEQAPHSKSDGCGQRRRHHHIVRWLRAIFSIRVVPHHPSMPADRTCAHALVSIAMVDARSAKPSRGRLTRISRGVTAAAVVAIVGSAGPVYAQDDEVVPSEPVVTAPLVQVPTGCPAAGVADVVFTGTVVATDVRSARFRVSSIRAGSHPEVAIDGLVDIRYGYDAQFLSVGETYVVGSSEHPDLGVLVSSTTIDPVDFAGDEIIGVSEDDVICPEFDEPVMTLRSDGSPVPAPLLSGLADDRAGVVTALVVPAVVVFVVVALLATLRVSTVGVLAGVARARRRNRSAARSQGPRA